ncbi:Fc.00g023200.m01.CDS01 [Cosmosporella sp. VM-42]
MPYSKQIKIIVTGCPRRKEGAIDKIIEKPAKEDPWSDGVIVSIKSWLATLVHGKSVVVIKEDEGKPLLEEEETVFMPKHAAASFLRTTTTRSMRKFNGNM